MSLKKTIKKISDKIKGKPDTVWDERIDNRLAELRKTALENDNVFVFILTEGKEHTEGMLLCNNFSAAKAAMAITSQLEEAAPGSTQMASLMSMLPSNRKK